MNIEDILNEVNNVGLCILPSMDYKTTYKLRGIIRSYKVFTTFMVKDLKNNELRVVVRNYKRDFNMDYSKLAKEALMYYRRGEYEKSLEINLQTLSMSLNPKPHPIILGNIGMCYLKLGNLETAITYLEVATLLSSNKKRKIDYSELISKLRRQKKKVVEQEDEDYKPDVNFGENEFSDSILYVRDMDKIISMINTGVGIKEACMSLGLSYEEYLRVLLIIAREYYYIGNSVQGDRLLNIVKRDKNKSRNIVKLIVEIENNKKFYQYRENDRERLVLKRNYLV